MLSQGLSVLIAAAFWENHIVKSSRLNCLQCDSQQILEDHWRLKLGSSCRGGGVYFSYIFILGGSRTEVLWKVRKVLQDSNQSAD